MDAEKAKRAMGNLHLANETNEPGACQRRRGHVVADGAETKLVMSGWWAWLSGESEDQRGTGDPVLHLNIPMHANEGHSLFRNFKRKPKEDKGDFSQIII